MTSELPEIDEIRAGDVVLSEYDTEPIEHRVVRVDESRGRVWIVSDTREGDPSPSYLNYPNGVLEHRPREVVNDQDDRDDQAADLEPTIVNVEPRDSMPQPPVSVADYVVEGVERQDPAALRSLAVWAARLAAWRDRELTDDDLDDVVDQDEKLEDVEKDGEKGVIVKKKIPCGKNCGGCPHGPYKYRAYRDGDAVKTDYLGPA